MTIKDFKQVYQFKITLKDIKPLIWRRIQVPETYTFWDLHVAIQDAMGWADYHLHEFEIRDSLKERIVRIGTPDEDDILFGEGILHEKREKVARWFSMKNRIAEYTYDFGDNWEHGILLEKIVPRDNGIKYPICIGGKRACPPEDCGGIWGYQRLLEAIKHPEDKNNKELLESIGTEYDPEYFNPQDVIFEDPDKHWQPSF